MNSNKISNILCIIVIITSLLVMLYFIIKSMTPINRIDEQTEIHKEDAKTTLKFDYTKYDFDECSKGDIIKCSYIIKNTGDKPLIIYSITPSCTCTSFSLSKKIIMPTDTAKIGIVLDTKDKIGMQIINTVVRANTPDGVYKLTLSGSIIKNK